MFKLYDKNKTFLRMVGGYKDMCIESELSNGDKTLTFTTHGKQTEIQNEYYIETDDDWFVVKEVKPTDSGAEYVAKLNLEELEANMIPSFSARNVTAAQAAQAAVQGTGWTVQSSLTKIRSVQQFKKTPYDLLMKIRDAFMCEIWFDTKSQIIHLEEQIGEDKGVFDGRGCVEGVVRGLQALIAEQRKVAELAEEAGDQGTTDIVTGYVQAQEKEIWMYNAFLG